MDKRSYRHVARFPQFCLCFALIVAGKTASAQQPGGPGLPAATPVAIPSAYTVPAINYVRTWEPSMPTSDPAVVIAASQTVKEVKQTTQYFDGLGRPLQTVAKGMSNYGKDIVTPVVYDAFGREQYKYLPYTHTAGDGKFKAAPFSESKRAHRHKLSGEPAWRIFMHQYFFGKRFSRGNYQGF